MHGKTIQVPVLRRDAIDRQRHPTDQGDGPPADPAVQGLRPEVHAETSEAIGPHPARKQAGWALRV